MGNRIRLLIYLGLFWHTVADAQTLTPLSSTSAFICVGTAKGSQIGKFTKTGYRLVSAGAAKDTLLQEREDFQMQSDLLKNVRKEIAKGKSPKKGELGKIKSTLKSINSPKFNGSTEEKLLILDQAIVTIKGLIALKKSENQALSDCIKDKLNQGLPAGSLAPQVIVIRNGLGGGVAVFGALVRDSRLYPAGGYCVKTGSEPAFELIFSTNPCPDVLTKKLCEGVLGSNKVGHFIGTNGAIFGGGNASEEEIQGVVGRVTAEDVPKIYQVRSVTSADAGKTCGQIFGE